ncbi:DinB family protein [Poseidonocella sedimentorum]|uniref:Uncharacterized damage-inducible protein DinB (Forms a four-helix bundle) n=1 Tax=Poseidonocella sedimentorum TaxID=871652 RepID=A0A1I6DHG5_9RHOB|nr:DinB family protein [Poseidonocella sedimentorum]SFR04837.1 Uncharacterized damage-inducible protein DinB (forms a four-helix bundle) [Poseidonocella sedimentorum]
MITPDYCREMARYNAWQNDQLREAIYGLPVAEITRDRGAFFGSILGTANHLLWGDDMWMARFGAGPLPEIALAESPALTPTPAAWAGARRRLDMRIIAWADRLAALDLVGDVSFFSGVEQREMSLPVGLAITHFFNHQTHHRGQIHTMLTQAGAAGPVTDLIFRKR